MMDVWKSRAVLAAALALASLMPAQAEARGNRFALACISSATGDSIYFAYRWGTKGRWTEVTADPGQWRMLMWNYDHLDENRSPQLQVRYDDDMTDGENFVVTDVAAFAAASEDCEGQGKTYHFEDRGGELFLVEDE